MRSKYLAKICVALAVVLYVIGRAFGDRLEHDYKLGSLLLGAFMFVVSLVFFLKGSIPYRPLTVPDASLSRGFRFSIVCLSYSLFQIPVWCLLTRRFPPDGFTETQAVFVAAGVIISMFGSGTPWIILFVRHIREVDRHQRELLKKQKSEDKLDR